MDRTYDIFEKFPDGCSIWRACVSGQSEVERKIQELTEHSRNEFFAIDLRTQERLRYNSPPRKWYETAKRSRCIA
jgi:hypothetical protein